MNREEILAKSRKENNDEGLIEAENRGRKIGIAVFCAVFSARILFIPLTGIVIYTMMRNAKYLDGDSSFV